MFPLNILTLNRFNMNLADKSAVAVSCEIMFEPLHLVVPCFTAFSTSITQMHVYRSLQKFTFRSNNFNQGSYLQVYICLAFLNLGDLVLQEMHIEKQQQSFSAVLAFMYI